MWAAAARLVPARAATLAATAATARLAIAPERLRGAASSAAAPAAASAREEAAGSDHHQLGVRQSLQVQALPTQVQQHQVLLLLLALVNEPGNADVRSRLVHLRVSVCALLFPLLLSVLEGGVDGLIGDLICLGFHGDIRADCLLQSAQINLVQQLDHRVELRLCLFDLLDVDTQLV
eukprot:CAMPEP_0170454694 /NCGR_PEP_ID=MMETSP0123-20130129/2856_1 /TAXON_ID=182087 /ORGANISM="Favella ehrenbergii, Strain Fehren 1" /LENGTH=176 /DNA_ID=CAMNT_0010717483 /DNA_START=1008 /DNA_END=1540 /DNA_ORIENTATION=-